ncbi:hypothetical protein AAG570_013050 [Ranatra chinensis]|uniref:Nuclear protein MDM1 n=1 Tax=Ranatra chinensis TaxID=642074 RepID=A0ABD0YFM8_9HEMI
MISGYPQESNHSGGLKSAISRISTEYRLQFSWPRGLKQRESEEERSASGPRKSVSMGAIKPTSNSGPPSNNIPPPAPVHKKRITEADKLDGSAELEPLVSDQDGVENSGEEKIQEESLSKEEKPQLSQRAEFKTEYKKKFRPFSQYDYVEGRFKPKRDEPEPEIVPDLPHGDSWFREVLELRKKAGEYKTDKMDEYKKEIPPRTRVDNIIRHHLERTTGSGGEGILQSPTREKLEPVIPRRKEPSSEANKSPQKTQQH